MMKIAKKYIAALLLMLFPVLLRAYSARDTENEFYTLYGGISLVFIVACLFYMTKKKKGLGGIFLGLATALTGVPAIFLSTEYTFHPGNLLPMIGLLIGMIVLISSIAAWISRSKSKP